MKKIKINIIQALEYLSQNPKISISKAALLFNVDRHTLAKYYKDKMELSNLYQNQSNPNDEYLYLFTDDELNFINYYLSNPTKNYNDILQHFGKGPERRALYHYLEILGKEKTEGQSIKYHYDRSKFAEIITEDDAYWLGFITADGCIIENKWLQIQLAARDRSHLVKFCQYLGLNEIETNDIIKDGSGGAYTRDNPINVVKICSQDIITNLQNKGITPRKSGKETPYVCSTPDLELAYIRGLIDGDGYLGSTQSRFGLVGSYEICKYVQNFITNHIKDISNNHIHEHGVIYKLEVNGNEQASTILTALYKNANIYLDRKYELFMSSYCRD